MEFNEQVFLWSLMHREEDAKRFMDTFQPEWMKKAENVAILSEVYNFLGKHGIPPSPKTLKQIVKDKDPIAFDARFKEPLENIENLNPDISEVLYVLGKAKDVAVVQSWKEMKEAESLLSSEEDYDSTEILTSVSKWLNLWAGIGDSRTLTIKEASDELIKEDGFISKRRRIPCGIDVLDEWTGGGLRRKQLGIIMGISGQGKSASLVVMADKIARVEDQNVWFVTNELGWDEVTERFATRMTGIPLQKIIDAPAIIATKIKRHWRGTSAVSEKLVISDYFGPHVSTADLESDMKRYENIYGWKPDVIVLDFMERMRPTTKGIRKDNEWIWLQNVAQDLVRFAKKHNVIIWTACQTNRAGMGAEKLDMSHAQSSTRHIQEATAFIGLRQRKILGASENEVGIEYFNLKQRQSKMSQESVVLKADLSRMSITNEKATVLDTKDSSDDNGSNNTVNVRPLPGMGQTPRQKQRGKRK